MAETSYPYAGGQGMTDAAYERLMANVTGNGRIDLDVPGNGLTSPIVYADSTGRQFKVRANTAYLVRGFRWESGTTGIVKALDANTSGNPRLDLVALRLDRANFTVRLVVIKGTPAAVPSLPSLTQSLDTTTSTRYEIPIASVRVASNNSANQPSIASGDVTSLEVWNAAPPQIGHSTAMASVEAGSFYTQYDTGKTYVGLSSKWYLAAEDGPEVKLSAQSGSWDKDRFYVYYRRRNGFVWLQALVYRTKGLADLAAGTDITVVTLPDAARPAFGSLYGEGVMGGNTSVRWNLNGSTGVLNLLDHAVLKADNFVHFSAFYPARNL
jgi:hypothetical protein